MKKNITEMRENLRNAQNELDAQRARNRTLVDNPAATATVPQNLRKLRRLTPRASSRESNCDSVASRSMYTSSLIVLVLQNSAIVRHPNRLCPP